jgi:hypothetical protein
MEAFRAMNLERRHPAFARGAKIVASNAYLNNCEVFAAFTDAP